MKYVLLLEKLMLTKLQRQLKGLINQIPIKVHGLVGKARQSSSKRIQENWIVLSMRCYTSNNLNPLSTTNLTL